MNESAILGQLVISSAFGLGRVVDLDNKGHDDQSFLVIECEEQKVKCFVPAADKKSYRLVASQARIDEVLAQMTGQTAPSTAFDSKKERINYFKSKSQIQDIELMSQLLKELNSLSDRGNAENQILTKLLDSLALEYSVITKKSFDEAKEYVLVALNGGPSAL